MAEGRITRGTTGVNRLRRNDRYLAALPVLRRSAAPLVVDLGFGARPWTALELGDRLARVAPGVRVLGLEIDPVRVAAAQASATDRVRFAEGGFEIPSIERPVVVRAMNVLRQYDESEVAAAWALVQGRIADGGVLVEGTCDELGRVASWIDVDAGGPQRFTVSLRLDGLDAPGVVAERLPKALIHRNVPGQRVHAWLDALDSAWMRAAPLSVWSPAQRFAAAAASLRADGWPVRGRAKRWRLGEVTVDWSAVAPT